MVGGVPAPYATIVALYGPKPDPLAELLRDVQAILSSELGESYRPYDLDHVHATLVAIDGRCSGGRLLNLNYRLNFGEDHVMDPDGIVSTLVDSLKQSLTISIGGDPNRYSHRTTSRGMPLADRMFSVQGRSVVVIGWPSDESQPLDRIRKQAAEAGALHKYFTRDNDFDDDFYMVVGHVDQPDCTRRDRATNATRSYLRDHPIDIEVGVDQAFVVAADAPTLEDPFYVRPLAEAYDVATLYRVSDRGRDG